MGKFSRSVPPGDEVELDDAQAVGGIGELQPQLLSIGFGLCRPAPAGRVSRFRFFHDSQRQVRSVAQEIIGTLGSCRFARLPWGMILPGVITACEATERRGVSQPASRSFGFMVLGRCRLRSWRLAWGFKLALSQPVASLVASPFSEPIVGPR